MFITKAARRLHFGFPNIDWIHTKEEIELYFESNGRVPTVLEPPMVRTNRTLRMILFGFANSTYTAIQYNGIPYLYCCGYCFGPLTLG